MINRVNTSIRAKYSPVGNINLLRRIAGVGMIPDYVLLLAHHVVEFPSAHKELRQRLSGATVILDNSLIELGGAVDIKVMQEACQIVEPTYIVLPDALMDRKTSVKLVQEAYPEWLDKLPRTLPYLFMAVVQGESQEELLECAKLYKQLDVGDAIQAFGVPRKFASVFGSRQQITRKLLQRFSLPIHLLGFSSHFSDDMLSAAIPGVMGIDSATPLRLGLENRLLSWAIGESLEDQLTVDREQFFRYRDDPTFAMMYNLCFIEGVLDALFYRSPQNDTQSAFSL